jgi:hypothetical protein
MSVAREREWDEDLRESHRTCGKSVGNLKAKRTIELTLAQRERLRRRACKERGRVVVVEVDAATRRSDGRGVGEETIV